MQKVFVRLYKTIKNTLIMKNLITTLAIVLTVSTATAQSFSKIKEVRKVNEKSLSALGFEKISSNDSIVFGFYYLNDTASLWVNKNTKEQIKVSAQAVEYVFNDTLIVDWTEKKSSDIDFALSKSIGDGWIKSPLTSYKRISKENLFESSYIAAYKVRLIKKYAAFRSLPGDSEKKTTRLIVYKK